MAPVTFVDTNVLLRYVVGDGAGQAGRARAFVDTADELVLTDPVVAEIEFVLRSVYRLARTKVAQTLQMILALPAIVVGDLDLLTDAIDIYERTPVDFQDAYLAAYARQHSPARIASFDRDFDRIPGVERVAP